MQRQTVLPPREGHAGGGESTGQSRQKPIWRTSASRRSGCGHAPEEGYEGHRHHRGVHKPDFAYFCNGIGLNAYRTELDALFDRPNDGSARPSEMTALKTPGGMRTGEGGYRAAGNGVPRSRGRGACMSGGTAE